MKPEDLILFSVIASLIWLAIIFAIIRYATKATSIQQNTFIQTKLMIKMAKLQGVTADEIDGIINESRTL